MNVASIIAATTIAKVWLALGGQEPRHGRASAFYREGDNQQAVSLNDAKACWYDFVTGEGGGMLDLIQHVIGCDRTGALLWLSSLTGLPLEDQPATRAERRVLAEQRKREQGEMRAAEFFRIAGASIAEQALDDELPAAVSERFGPTQFLLNLRGAHGDALLALYRDYLAREPRLAAALVYAGERAWRRRCTALARFVAALAGVQDAA